ncbi:MAG TPA: hypothetical protein VKE88_01200, partial [Candidatus Nanoarchaeia archaeon]|nr:hypothetical protein [Candidatus Nanoarchaeia archaeon]
MLFSKRAQLTPFIIVGIVIITIFGFVFFATGQVQQAQSEQQAEKIASEIVQTTPLRFYVNLCTEKALRSAVDILGKQGGKVFPSQNGSIMKRNEKAFLYKEADTTYFVGYGILNNNVPLPQYPCKLGFTNYDLPPAYCEYISTNTKFNRLDLGMPNLPELCKDARSGCSISEQGFNPQFSVQAELEGYVSAYVKDCVDFESIIGINQTYDVTEGDVFTNISMSDKSISANVNFPLVIAVQGTQPVIQFISFESTTQTRFKLLYGLVKSALKREVSSSTAPGFKFTQGFLELAQEQLGNNHGFVITKRENVSFYDDFIQIIDTQSDPTQQLVFQFVVENRPPILNYIDPRAKTKTDCGDFDYIAIQDKPITLPISWFDTEEDGVTISVFGWLEEYNETNIVPEEFTGCPIPIVQKKIFNDIPLQRRWKTTDDGTNAKTLSTQLFADDIGPHQFVVQVCDAQYCDNQTVRVLVDDLIKVTVDKKNEYGGGIFSTEDPFTFTAKIQDIYNPGAYKFSWVIRNALGADVFTDETEGTELKIPTSTYSIINIHKAFQSNPLFELGKKYTVVGKVVQAGQFESENKTDIIPQACVSYTSVTSPRSFPYNTSDPYLSTHACCAADNTLKPTSATCFTETTYGTFKSFNLNQYQTAYDALLPSDKVNGVNPTSSKIFTGFSTALGSDPIATLKSATVVSDNSNDIIQRSFERKCDGTRGNICVGNFV